MSASGHGEVAGLVEELRAGLEGVTPGPWYQTGAPWFRSGDGVLAGSPDGNVAFLIADLENFAVSRDEYEGPFPLGDAEKDAAHIARCSPDNIAKLLNHIDALTARCEHLSATAEDDGEASETAVQPQRRGAGGWCGHDSTDARALVNEARADGVREDQIDAALAAYWHDMMQGPADQTERTAMRAALLAALESTPAQPVREVTDILEGGLEEIIQTASSNEADRLSRCLETARATLALASSAGRRSSVRMLVNRDQLRTMIEQSPDDEESDAGVLHPEAPAQPVREGQEGKAEPVAYCCPKCGAQSDERWDCCEAHELANAARRDNVCDCERSHNGLGIAGRQCDCPAGAPYNIKAIACVISLSYGENPEDDAPLGKICGPNNEPLPNWMAYEEQAKAVFTWMMSVIDALASQPAKIARLNTALQAEIERGAGYLHKLAATESELAGLKEALQMAIDHDALDGDPHVLELARAALANTAHRGQEEKGK